MADSYFNFFIAMLPGILLLGAGLGLNFRRIDSFVRRRVEKLFGVTVVRGRLGVWQVTGDSGPIARLAVEALQFVYLAVIVVAAITLSATLLWLGLSHKSKNHRVILNSIQDLIRN